MFEYLGLVLTLASWASIVYLLIKWKGEHTMSISLHAASAQGALVIFRIVLILLGVLFYWWLIEWFAPKLAMSTVFVSLLTLTIMCQIIAALAPDRNGWRRIVHRTAAWMMAALYLPLSWLMLTSSQVSDVAKVIGLVSTTYMVSAALAFFVYKRARKKFLFFQAFYIVAFQIFILSAAFL